MEKCYLCGQNFEPLIELPELPELWGIKPPPPLTKIICPSCALKGAQDILRFATLVLEVISKAQEKKE